MKGSKAQWLAWLETLHPSSIELGLGRVGQVWTRLRPDPLPFTAISVAGTNGKGSSVALLEAIYRAAGYRIGAYTSPHLIDFNERIRIDGQLVTDEALCAAFEAVEAVRGPVSLTYFEFTTLAALWLFCQAGLELVILEVGLGGRLDAVKIVDADVALVTSIAFDHQAWLGNDLDSIAREKAGIARAGRPLVFNGDQPVAGLLEAAQRIGAQLLIRGRDYQLSEAEGGWSWRMGTSQRHGLPWPGLRGRHQLHNAAAVLTVVGLLEARWPVSQEAVRSGLLQARVTARFQVVPGAVTRVLDVAHNPESATALAANLQAMACSGRTLAVFGVLADKDVQGVIAPLLPVVDGWYLSAPACERALRGEALGKVMTATGAKQWQVLQDLTAAYDLACSEAQPGDRIVIFGSFYTVAELLPLVYSPSGEAT